MKWADLIVPVGGDGTFLLAAGRASPLFAQSQQKTPIVGFNSDPQRSEGRLMLPKHYTENTADAVTKIKSVGKLKNVFFQFLNCMDEFYLTGRFSMDVSNSHPYIYIR